MSSQVDTREFVLEDYDAAVELWKQVEGLEIAEGDDKESLGLFLKRNPGLSRVAVDGSRIVGVAMCGHDGRRGYIYHLAIDPDYRGRGVGKRLEQECLQGLRRDGVQRALILVAEENKSGRAFWERQRWEGIDGAMVMGKDTDQRSRDEG